MSHIKTQISNIENNPTSSTQNPKSILKSPVREKMKNKVLLLNIIALFLHPEI